MMQSVLKGQAGAIFPYHKLCAVVQFATCETARLPQEKLFLPCKMLEGSSG